MVTDFLDAALKLEKKRRKKKRQPFIRIRSTRSAPLKIPPTTSLLSAARALEALPAQEAHAGSGHLAVKATAMDGHHATGTAGAPWPEPRSESAPWAGAGWWRAGVGADASAKSSQ